VVATTVNATRAHEALKRVRELVEGHASAEQLARLDRIDGGRIPSPMKRSVEFSTYQAEALVILAEMFAELKAANTPRRRGRPPKADNAA
jgi:hypothetical protein